MRPDQKQRAPGTELPTKNSITTQRPMMEVPVFIEWIRFELIRLGFDQLLEVSIVPNGDKGLHIELKAQRWGKTDVRSRCEVQGSAFEFAIGVVFFEVLFNLLYPLCLFYPIAVTWSDAKLNVGRGTNTEVET